MRILTRILISLVVGVLAACGGGDESDLLTGPGDALIGKAAPDFTLVSSTGENVHLADQRGKVVMLHFWASWCGPCRQVMPLIDSMYKRYNAAGFVIYGVNVEEDHTNATKFLKELDLAFPILYDPKFIATDLYLLDAIPTTVVIDKAGNIRFINRGYRAGDENKYRDQIRELIRE